MESNFHLKTQDHNQQLYIDLHGVFDGASAFELVHAIENGYQCKGDCKNCTCQHNR